MRNRKAKVLIWGTAAALSGLLVLTIGPRLFKVWRCYDLANSAEREVGTVVGKHESVGLVFTFGQTANPSDSCTAETSAAVYEAAQIGDTFEVVRKPGRSDLCYLTSSLAASGLILASLSGLAVIYVLLVLAFAYVAQRSFAGVPKLTTEFVEDVSAGVSCPGCARVMDVGYIVPFAGIHWRDADEAIGLPTALGGLSGTVGWRGRPCLQAFRCETCGTITFKYRNADLAAVPAGVAR